MHIFQFRKRTKNTPTGFQWKPVSQRSSLTAPMPHHIPEGRVRRTVLRTITTAALSIALVTLVQAIRTKSLGNDQLPMLLYQIHDTIYLPLKGYSYELFFPTSLIWYGVVTSIFLLWLAFYLTDRSLVRRPHIVLLRHAVAIGHLRIPLVGVSRLLLRAGLPPNQIRYVAEHERDIAALRLAAGHKASGQRLRTLSRLLIDLSLLYPERLAVLQAACDWQEAMLILRASGNPAAHSLAPALVPTITRTLPTLGLTPIDAILDRPAGLDITSCLTDALRLALLAGAELPNLEDPRIGAVLERDSLVRGLAWAAERRREQIDQLRARLEQVFSHPHTQAANNPIEQGYIPDATLEELPFLGRLALSSAFAAAYELRSNDLALSVVESADALVLALACLGQNTPPYLIETVHRAYAWVGNGPTPSDRQIVASLDQSQSVVLHRTWKPYLSPTGPIRAADLALVDRRSIDMFRAAGLGRETNILDNSQDEGP